MTLLITGRGRLQQARGLASVLDAPCDAFEDILVVIGKDETTTSTDEEFYRQLNGVVIDDIELFNERLQARQDFCNCHRPTAASRPDSYERLLQKTTPATTPK